MNCSRQAGKSTAAAVLALHTALHRPGSLVLLVAPVPAPGGRAVPQVRRAARPARPGAGAERGQRVSCTFAGTGSRVLSLPGSEATVRGFSRPPTLIVEDEAARVPDALYRSIRPMLATSAGRPADPAVARPFGQRGHFWQEWSDGGPDWRRVEVPAERVPRISPDFLEAERRALGDAWFDQEYLCRFVQAADQIFDPASIARAFAAGAEPLAMPAFGDGVKPLFAGG